MSDRPYFLEPPPTDLHSLTRTRRAKTRGMGQRDWQLTTLGSGSVVIDAQRVTQALLQLADNAVKHTGEGAAIALGSAYDGREVRLWVADSGPGVPPAERAQIFERFGRGGVGTVGDDGFGLGLSIVSAIATAHGGSIRVSDDPALGGARFELTIPQGPQGPQGPQEQTWPAS
jgi:signal transduction histidine kinase